MVHEQCRVAVLEASKDRVNFSLETTIELLVAISSIICGMWALCVWAPVLAETVRLWMYTHLGHLAFIGTLFQGSSIGIGVFTAGWILASMMIPCIAAGRRDVFTVLPKALKDSQAMQQRVQPWREITATAQVVERARAMCHALSTCQAPHGKVICNVIQCKRHEL